MVQFSRANIRILFIFLLSMGLGQQATAEPPSARAWLDTMSFALQQRNYEGTFVYRRGEQLAALEVEHINTPGGEREVIRTLSGEFREISRDSNQFQVFGATSLDGKGRFNVEKSYSLELGPLDRVAGRAAQVLNIVPKDGLRYGYRLWLDQETGLLLKSDLFDTDGHILEQVMFTSLTVLEGLRNSDAEHEDVDIASPSVEPSDSIAWQLLNLPQGFSLIDRKSPETNRGIEHIIYSDGLASVSVFFEKTSTGNDVFKGVSNMGAVNAFGNILNGFQVTVVGEVPEATVRLIGSNLSLRQVE